jgi:hypothetical protein
VTVAELPEQTDVELAVTVTVGGGLTVITPDPVAGCVQLGVPAVVTLTNVKVVVAV